MRRVQRVAVSVVERPVQRTVHRYLGVAVQVTPNDLPRLAVDFDPMASNARDVAVLVSMGRSVIRRIARLERRKCNRAVRRWHPLPVNAHHRYVMLARQSYGHAAAVTDHRRYERSFIPRSGSDNRVLAAGATRKQDGRNPRIAAPSRSVKVEEMPAPTAGTAPLMAQQHPRLASSINGKSGILEQCRVEIVRRSPGHRWAGLAPFAIRKDGDSREAPRAWIV